MNPYIGQEAYNFTAKTVMPDNVIENEFNLKKYLNGDVSLTNGLFIK